MKTKLLLFICLLTLFTTACEPEEAIKPKEATPLEMGIENLSYITSADGSRNNLLAEERLESSLSRAFGKQVYTAYVYAEKSGISRSGSKSARIELRKGSGKVRSEIWREAETSSNRWYGMSLYLPSANWATDKDPDAWDMITQWHATDDSGESKRFPPISLVVMKGNLRVVVYWATRAKNTNSSISGKKVFDLGPVEKGKWLDMVYHINFSENSDGVLQVWKNGKKVIDYKGPNSYNDRYYPYLKAGIYKRNWNHISSRVIYLDEIRVGGPKATYKDVAPAGSGSSQPDDDSEDTGTSGQKITSFTLINADTDRDIRTITNGATLDLSSLGTRNLNVRANTNTSVGSVYFSLSGAQSHTRTEGSAPVALFGDSNKNYHAWRPKIGSYTLKATPYSGSNRKGTIGTPLTINFKVVE